MDSVIGALSYAYLLSKTSTCGHTFIPVLNCAKNEFYCRLEIVKHLTYCGVKVDDLVFYEDLELSRVTEVALFDHNILDISQRKSLEGYVTRIIDHHFNHKAH